MKIGILGSGLMASALGEAWIRAGHEIMIGGRSLFKSTTLANSLQAAKAGTPREAAEFGDAFGAAPPKPASS